MAEKLELQEIRAYWQQQAQTHGQSPAASWSDTLAIELEIQQIASLLNDGDRVLDVGCANGYSTVELARRCKADFRGLDYIDEMIAAARARLMEAQGQLRGRVTFAVGDITSLREPSDFYDKVVVIRVVINLRTWEGQVRGLRECVRVLRPGGLLLLSEATRQGWQSLNAFRAEWGLPPIPMPPFNEYLDEQRVIAALTEQTELVELRNFASTYYVGTRVLKPLLAQVAGAPVHVSDPHSHWNRFFALLPAAGDYGTQKLFVFRKR